MARNISLDNFRAKIAKTGVAHSNYFRILLNFPNGVTTDLETVSVLCKSAQLPGYTITSVEIPFMGQKLKEAGDVEYENWNLTFISDSKQKTREAFEQWQNLIRSHVQNTGANTSDDYKMDLEVSQLDKKGEITKTYYMVGCWPTNVSTVDVSMDNENAIEEFTVDFSIDRWDTAGTR